MSRSTDRTDAATREALEMLGGVLRQLRGGRGLSQRGLAARSGLSQSTISRLECGLAEGARAACIARLLAGLDSRVRSLPDDRPMLERYPGFRRLRNAFSADAGAKLVAARDERRRDRFEAYARSLGASEFEAEAETTP